MGKRKVYHVVRHPGQVAPGGMEGERPIKRRAGRESGRLETAMGTGIPLRGVLTSSRTHKVGETAMPDRGRSRFQAISTCLTLDFDRKLELTGDFLSAGAPFSCPGEFFLIGTRIFSHGHENSVCSWCRSAGQRVGRRDVAPSLILSAAQNPLPLLLIYRATSKGSAGAVDTPRGAPPALSVNEGGRPSRRWGGGGKGRERGETAASFPHRAAVPVERGGRSGATA